MNHFKDLITNNSITKPLSWVTDKEIALMNCIDQLFLDANHLLCTWHVNINILANCQKHYPKDIRNPLTATTANPQGYVPNPEWTDFLKD
jgi:hypothetical protein